MLSLLPWVAFVGVGTPLAVIDWREHRLPNRLVGILAASALVTLGLAAWAEGTPANFARALAGGALLSALFLALAVIKPSAMGMGDVKVSVVIGAYLSWLGWAWLWWGTVTAFTAAALVGVVCRVGLRQPIALGPFLLGAVLVCAVAATRIAI